MTKLRMSLAAFAVIAFGGLAIAQGQGLFGPFPVVGGSSYCSSTNNGVCTNTVPAGPTTLTGNEGILANTNLSQGRSPQNVLITPASLGSNPISFVTVTSSSPSVISATNINGGVYYNATGTITSAGISLPTGAIHGQTYRISANRTITTLAVGVIAPDTMAANTSPTTLTASTTAPQGYTFICNKTSGTSCVWGRLQ